jgi:hypothetical protein
MQRDKNQDYWRKYRSCWSEINLYHFIYHVGFSLRMVKLWEDVHDLFSCSHLFFNQLQIIHFFTALSGSLLDILTLKPSAKHPIFLESFKSIESVCLLIQKTINLILILRLKEIRTVEAHMKLLIYYSISH